MKANLLGLCWRKEKGQALVELAIVLPLLLMLLLGIVEFGRVGHAYLTLNHAAREGARAGVTGASDQEVVDVVQAAAATLQQSALVITLDPPYSGDRVQGGAFAVMLSYELELFIPVPAAVFPNPLALQGRVVMRME